MKQCPICKKEVSLEELLLKHMNCTSEDKQKEQKTILNSSIEVEEAQMSIVQKEFWEENKEEILKSIEKINYILGEKNIPLFVAESIGVASEKDFSHAWYFYVCNRETELEAINIGNNEIYTYTYPAKYPTIEEGKIVEDIIVADKNLIRLSQLDTNFKHYYISYDNIKSPAEYQEEHHRFLEFVEEKRNELKQNFISERKSKELESAFNSKLSWLSRLWHLIVYKFLG